jgi:hypothetical protein
MVRYFPKNNPCTVCIKDDPGAKEAFFGGGSKYFEQIRNHSRVGYSVMFCVRWVSCTRYQYGTIPGATVCSCLFSSFIAKFRQ